MSGHHLQSRATGGREDYWVYQPPGTDNSDRLPLLVLLHGLTSDHTQWLDVGIASAADCLIARHQIRPLLIVLANGGRVEQQLDGPSPPMERLVVDELLPAVRRAHPHFAGPSETSVGGISLGGGWALRIAARHPGLFGAVGGHSPASLLTEAEVSSLATHHQRVWLDAGGSDGFRKGVRSLADRLGELGSPAQLRTWPGGHTRRYWSEHAEDYLRFYSASR